MAPTRRTQLGLAGEQAAAAWLAARGYEILARNARTRFGEIDLVARQGALVVFVEVKSRSSAAFGHPAEAVAGRKQRRLAHLAAAFLAGHGLAGSPARFDVIAVHLDAAGVPRVVDHLPGAFEL
ncbi:MAG: YraN family protein [Armatimonadota bacterium]|nr:YraN family protein [Armatimonadota bacterium]MDR7422071.1 YraN family protein [Armatimonadota bacterium]MDR7454135.1 YraN family protein [Armatimonadota bacterium]MDR7456234.1 YraN family protein [Armatimonadota bacterium]MDR7496898.1 YraN family protein [Armatimonadota bacterium]